MQNLNKCIVSGHLGQDPTTVETENAPTRFSIAVNERWGTGSEKKERVNWFPVVVWGNVAKMAKKYLKKGSHVLVEGSLRLNEWEDEKGKHSRVEIVAANILFLDKKVEE
jgi:single-strand DNA-binding protein